MAVRLLVDECLQARLLVSKLIEAGHDVQTASQAGVVRVRDEAVFAKAIAENRIVLTVNCNDFVVIAQAIISQGEHHPGVFMVFLQNDPNRDMSYDCIVKAIANLESTQLPLADSCHSLNLYDY